MRTPTRWKPLLLIVVTICISQSANANRSLVEAVQQAAISRGAESAELYIALRALGRQQLESADHRAALDTFRRMQSLIHRTSGVHSPLQQESVIAIIDAYRNMGDYQQAETQHLFLFDIARRAYAPNALEMQAARIRLANWYRQSARHRKAIDMYGEVLSDIPVTAQNAGVIVHLLRAQALSLHVSGRCCASRNLARAEEIVKTYPDFDQQNRQRASLDHADALLLERRRSDAKAAYAAMLDSGTVIEASWLGTRRAQDVVLAIRKVTAPFNPRAKIWTPPKQSGGWEFGGKAGLSLPTAIGQPVPVCSSTVTEVLAGVDREQLATYYVDIDISLDAAGRPETISLEGNTPTRLNRYLRAILQESSYRPQIVSTGFSEQSSLSFRQTFSPDASMAVGSNAAGWNQVLTSEACQKYDLGIDTNLAYAGD